jgi:phosphopantothenoylcysteine decarboxylase/phosphopantothenate--cysteine ligase
VTLVAGPTRLEDPRVLAVTHVETATEMQAALEAAARDADVVVMAAAIGDFRPIAPAAHKLKRSEMVLPLSIQLDANPDLLAGLGAKRKAAGRGPLLVGFAAETRDVVDYARAKLRSKGCDLVVANDVTEPGAGFAVDTNHVFLVEEGAVTEVPPASKRAVAHRILDRVVGLISKR